MREEPRTRTGNTSLEARRLERGGRADRCVRDAGAPHPRLTTDSPRLYDPSTCSFLDEWFVRHEPLANEASEDDHDRKSRNTSRVVPAAGDLNLSCFNRATTSRR